MIPNTFGIPATADKYIVIHSDEELHDTLTQHSISNSPLQILPVGAGSNMVFTRHYAGTVLHMANRGIECLSSCGEEILVKAAAGEVWDDFVHYCIAHGWYGSENLVAIPGTVGAAPVQNVGAYGCEAKDIIAEVHTREIETGKERIFSNEECHFGYRDSIFKNEMAGRYVVSSVVFKLNRTFVPNMGYKALNDALAAKQIDHPTAQQLADTITEMRWSKLPRPEETGSAGSFFKNPVVAVEQYESLKAQHPDLVAFPVAEGTAWKLAAGWLIEHAGWKGRTLGRCGVYEKQALVLVNRGGCTGQDVVTLSNAIIADVKELFGVTLQPEAIII